VAASRNGPTYSSGEPGILWVVDDFGRTTFIFVARSLSRLPSVACRL